MVRALKGPWKPRVLLPAPIGSHRPGSSHCLGFRVPNFPAQRSSSTLESGLVEESSEICVVVLFRF